MHAWAQKYTLARCGTVLVKGEAPIPRAPPTSREATSREPSASNLPYPNWKPLLAGLLLSFQLKSTTRSPKRSLKLWPASASRLAECRNTPPKPFAAVNATLLASPSRMIRLPLSPAPEMAAANAAASSVSPAWLWLCECPKGE